MNRKAFIPCFPFTHLLVVLSITLYFLPHANAQEHREDGDHFDGSEFNAFAFEDNSFKKENYKELRSTKDRGPLGKGAESSVLQDERHSSKKRSEEMGVKAAGSENAQGSKKKEGLSAKEKLPPVVDLPSDWVPDAVDLTSNGGFTIMPDNGSPVPYRLNGHIDIERGRP